MKGDWEGNHVGDTTHVITVKHYADSDMVEFAVDGQYTHLSLRATLDFISQLTTAVLHAHGWEGE